MTPPKIKGPADQAQRDAAIGERARNVLIDAGAGTGKTTLLADRLVEMVAPERSNAVPISIERIAAITFTRKAAGELKLRVRERLLSGLARCDPPSPRANLLRKALSGLDTAHISTIHSFCDRLLRLRPVDARLSPSYDIAEEPDALVAESFTLLLEAAQAGTLAATLAGTSVAQQAVEAQQTIVDAITAGLRRDTLEREFNSLFGLDALVSAFVLQRDVPFTLPDAVPFDSTAFQEAAAEFIERASSVEREEARGPRWIRLLSATLKGLKNVVDPVEIWADLGRIPRGPDGRSSDVGMKKDFPNAKQGWRLWKSYTEGDSKSDPPEPPLRDQLLAPLHRWMAIRLVRLFPVVVALFDKVKARRRQLDQIDLLLLLRDLLVRNRAARGFYQQLFDHIFVDEFQDTDPLQAEVVLLLCEKKPVAAHWDVVDLLPGKLTLVGDPKQSIYRFRRADIAVYEQVRTHVQRAHCLSVTLSTNFRSAGPIIDWVNERFARVLGPAQKGEPLFDAATGTVRYQPLEPGPRADRTQGPRVRALALQLPEKAKADDYRMLEAEALAKYLRHLVDAGETKVIDPIDGKERELRYGDIAVLAISTWNLRLLFPEFDRFGVPFASRGGRLLLQDPLHQQFVLALRGIADRDDGPAQAALFRAPFFSVDLIDLLHERGQRAIDQGEPLPGQVDPARAQRARDAVEMVRDLRQRRHARPVGATARDLLERTAFGRSLATGPNGEQRLERVREIIRALETLASAEGLDYDGATERVRAWVDAPIQLDPPYPVGTEAVQVLTVHQAKGLEFPVVVLWDGMAWWTWPQQAGAFCVSRDGRAWSMRLDGLAWEEPDGADIAGREDRFRDAERRRVVYVAATRARDLFVLADPAGTKCGKHISADLLVDAPVELVARLDAYTREVIPDWARDIEETPEVAISPPRGKEKQEAQKREANQAQAWESVAAASARPHLMPTSVTQLAHAANAAAFVRTRTSTEEVVTAEEEAPRPRRESRFGNRFGDAVHRAIGLVLGDANLTPRQAVVRAARIAALSDHLDEAVADVERALATLRQEGLGGSNLRLEYPVWSAADGEHLVQGFIDLLAIRADGALVVVDFKTDAPPQGDVEREQPAYVAQVRAYQKMLDHAGMRGSAPTRCALLFTADGAMRWC